MSIQFSTPDCVHIWQLSVKRSVSYEKFYPQLSQDEQKRARRFVHAHHQQFFIASRFFLRAVLANYVDVRPESLSFAYSEYGKPSLTDLPELQFNLSHSHQQAILAVGKQTTIGIDIEYLREMDNLLALSERFFSKNEVKYLRSLSKSQQNTAFFQLWTAKEAYLKATGEGVRALEDIEVNWFDKRFKDRRLSAQALKQWHLLPIVVNANYLSNLAIKSATKPSIVYQDYPSIVADAC